MRSALRVVRVLVGMAVLAASVGWLLLRRRTSRADLDRSRARSGPGGGRLSLVDPSTAAPATAVRSVPEPVTVPAPPAAPAPAAAPTPAPGPLPVPQPVSAPEAVTPTAEDSMPAPEAVTPAPQPVSATEAAASLAEGMEPGAEVVEPERRPLDQAAEPPGGPSPTADEPVAVQPDDLRKIRGVGPRTESMLHELGIRTYRQLGTLDHAGLDRLRAALRDFPQRVDREDWLGQARELHRDKYGEDV